MNRVRGQTQSFISVVYKTAKRRFRLKPSSNCTEELPPVGCPYYHSGMSDSSCHSLFIGLMPLYIHFSFTRRIFHLLLVTKVRLFEKSSVRRENLGTRLLSGSSIGWFHYLFVWNKIYFFLTHKHWYFMNKSIYIWSSFRLSTRETRNECSESSRTKLAR